MKLSFDDDMVGDRKCGGYLRVKKVMDWLLVNWFGCFYFCFSSAVSLSVNLKWVEFFPGSHFSSFDMHMAVVISWYMHIYAYLQMIIHIRALIHINTQKYTVMYINVLKCKLMRITVIWSVRKHVSSIFCFIHWTGICLSIIFLFDLFTKCQQ